ncbi:hypothetical protein Poli38472_000711 [Pythium oligandrum]|uniref:Uncharacterized protein n=1 Tax=Pythium oligandrum TaxID=41045 RepID=A0A8K1CC51_PYTOL|nr:hypothetical protein Poli38472_000711 [Pythium oligandrum]|eukprot:TMW60669.1 hypothetical protein Poli38472_000711 [Pythium oligandrum]
MVQYHLAGRVNCEDYVICERLLDILNVSLPDFAVTKTPYRQDQWSAAAAELSRVYGLRLPTASGAVICDVVVWSDTGRLVSTDADSFSTFALRTYGVQLDLTEAEVTLYMRANVDELRQQSKKIPSK